MKEGILMESFTTATSSFLPMFKTTIFIPLVYAVLLAIMMRIFYCRFKKEKNANADVFGKLSKLLLKLFLSMFKAFTCLSLIISAFFWNFDTRSFQLPPDEMSISTFFVGVIAILDMISNTFDSVDLNRKVKKLAGETQDSQKSVVTHTYHFSVTVKDKNN